MKLPTVKQPTVNPPAPTKKIGPVKSKLSGPLTAMYSKKAGC